MEENEKDPIALHVIVVGFHHKKGMQVEYCYPPLSNNDITSGDLPEAWRHLPSLCLPDGAHNHEADTVFFHLPHLVHPDRTVFGVSCYRQIDAEMVTNKTADITRNSVQKSVCVLCTLPIYGYIQERLQVTTRVYFKGADFTDVRDLEGLYHDLNTANWRDKLHHGVSVSDCVRLFGRNLLVLFKLVLLERGVLVYHSPVSPVVKTIASLLALLPHTLPHGVMAAAAINNFDDASQHNIDSLDGVGRMMKSESNSLSSSTDSALEKSSEIKQLSDSTSGKTSNSVNRNGSSKLKFKKKQNQACKSSDSNQSDDSAVVDVAACHKSSSKHALYGEGATLKIYTSEDDNNASPSLSKGRVSSLRDSEQERSVDNQSVDSGSVVTSNRATTGGDTPTNTLQDSLSELRSSNSSLTSVTSRASFLSPQQPDGPDDGSQLSSPPLSSRFTKSLKGRLSGAISYWTGGKERPVKGSSPTPACSPSGEEEASVQGEEEEEKEDQYPMSPASGAPLVFPELQQNCLQQPPLAEDANGTSSVATLQPSPAELFATLEAADCGLPLPLFAKGYLVHPYLSLQQLDVLSSSRTRAFLAGASNTLFLHKRPLYDVLVQVSEGKVEIMEPELRRQLSLSTEDLRFADNIVRQVESVMASSDLGEAGPSAVGSNGGSNGSSSSMSLVIPTPLDVWVEGVGWAGGEEWLRHQFRVYLLTMLRTSLLPEGSRELEMFNSAYMSAWRQTHNYREWLLAGPYDKLMEISPCHPNAGHLSMADVRIRLAHSLLGSDRSRRFNQTLASTGTAVVKTKEAVGGALTSAKGALSSLWSSITTTPASNGGHDDLQLDDAVEATESGRSSPHSHKSSTSTSSSKAKSKNKNKAPKGDIVAAEDS